MDHLVKVRDREGHIALTVVLDDARASASAADFVLDVLGAPAPEALPPGVTLPAGQWEALSALQRLAFDRDAEGLVMREDMHVLANGRELDPDTPLRVCFAPMAADGRRYMRCELVLAPEGPSRDDTMRELARLGVLHMLAIGRTLDVTREYPELAPVLDVLEAEALIAIDVPRHSWALTQRGHEAHRQLIDEAQALIRRFDIYGDVDVDPEGAVHFDSGLGQDWRVAAYEHEGFDPFRSRFVLGLNDGEWDALPDWESRLVEANWYDAVFAPVEAAPTVEAIGADKLERVMAAGKRHIREDAYRARNW